MENSRVTAVVALGLCVIGVVFYLMVDEQRDDHEFEAYDSSEDAVEVADTGLAVPSVTAMRRAGADDEDSAPIPRREPTPSDPDSESDSDQRSNQDEPSRTVAVDGTDDTLNRPGPSPSELPPGNLDRDTVKQGIEAVTPLVKVCYEETLKDFPDAEGKITVGFRIIGEEGEGRVEMSELDPERTTLFDEKLHDCMLKSVGEAQFEAPEGGGVVNVRYPFVFETDAENSPD